MYNHSPQIPFSFPGIEEDVSRLKRLFENALALLSWIPPPSPKIVNLACGRADETGVLCEVFSPQGPAGHYLAADLRHAEISEARQRWAKRDKPQFTTEFVVADASSAHALPTVMRFDVVFLRHQNYWDSPAVWDRIFHNALQLMQDDALLLFTSYFDREHELAIAALQTRGAHLLVNMPHVESRALADAPGKSVDRRIAVFSKQANIDMFSSEAVLAHASFFP